MPSLAMKLAMHSSYTPLCTLRNLVMILARLYYILLGRKEGGRESGYCNNNDGNTRHQP